MSLCFGGAVLGAMFVMRENVMLCNFWFASYKVIIKEVSEHFNKWNTSTIMVTELLFEISFIPTMFILIQVLKFEQSY